jgi:hypothetical protein
MGDGELLQLFANLDDEAWPVRIEGLADRLSDGRLLHESQDGADDVLAQGMLPGRCAVFRLAKRRAISAPEPAQEGSGP